jgi:phosphatidylserine/phosphatidylglycerophosphate/cardiolipin synthase-like enzyme
LLFSLSTSLAFCQTLVKEDNFTTKYFENKIELQFNALKPVVLKAFDNTSNQEIPFEKINESEQTYVLTAIHPAEIIRLEYAQKNNRGTVATSYLATRSASTGAINVYFNHPVTTTVAQTQNAVNLGNTLDDKLIATINTCVSTLDIAIYNSESPSASTGIVGAINAAYARGVRVRVIYDGGTSSQMIPLLNPAIPTLPSPQSVAYGIMHNKFVIFDANNADASIPLVWTGSTNWTVAQIDGPDKNSVITIQDQSLALGYKIEFEEMWGASTLAPDLVNSKFGPFKTDNTPHNYVIGGKVIENYFSPSDGVNSRIINSINSANSDIDIATMLITRSDIKDALLNKYNAGFTNINLLVDSQNPSGNQFPTIQAGITAGHAVKKLTTGIMHHKFMVIDNFDATSDPQVLVGSHNWSSAAETKNDENTLIVHDANITNQYYQAFVYLYGTANGVLAIDNNTFTAENLAIYPNPSNGVVTIENRTNSTLSNVAMHIFDITGKQIYTHNYTNLMHEDIDLSNESNGLYFIELQSDSKVVHYKLIKN